MDVILTPLSTGKLDKTDIEILKDDRECLEQLVQSILDNRRLAWMVVQSWLRKNEYKLLPYDSPLMEISKALCQAALSNPVAE